MTGSVICFVILCFILALASFGRSQGYNGCKSKEWHYHDHTHSCFRLFRYNYSWDYSKRFCQKFWGAPDYRRNGILARIDDEETNTFVKGLLKTGDEAWIGLRGRGQGSAFRWQGYPNEEPSFFKFASAPQTNSEVSTVITSSFWKTLQPLKRRHFICQVKAEILRTKITCPPAIKQNHNLNQPVTCEFYFNEWKSVTWFSDTTELATCSKETSSCSNRDQRSEASLRGKKTSLSYHGIIKRQFRLKCRIISTDDKVLDTKTCDLQVYEPPNTISCTLELAREKLQVVCKTAKIYPEASCKWFYKNQNDTSFRTVSISEARNRTHEEFYDGDKYFRSQCHVNLTKKGTDFKVGLMSVKVIMYPTVKESDLSTNQDASAECQEEVFIELPRQPMFTVNGTPYTESVTFSEGDVMTVKCQVKSGRPSVYTTTMSCGFPIMPSGRHTNTWKGISYVINNKKAEGNMDGKFCSCWGNHITGNSEKSTLKFNVSYPVSVQSFTANGRMTQLTISEDTQVHLRCQSSGKPMPLVEIQKTDNLEEDIVKGSKYTNELRVPFRAQCMDNGKYLCLAENKVKERKYEDSLYLDIHVKCLPTPCDGQKARPSVVARVGKEALVELCAVGYPKPQESSCFLLKEDGGPRIIYPKQKYSIEYLMQGNHTVRGVKIKFNKIETDDHGNFTLRYMGTGYDSNLYFQLSSKGPPDCPKNVTVIDVGHSSVFLSWVPGSDNGYNQTFVISRHNKLSEIGPLKEVQAVSADDMTYNLTRLSPETEYLIRVDAWNQEGNVSCPGNIVNFTTRREPEPLAGSDTSGGIIVAVVFIIIIVIVIGVVGIAVFLFLRKRKRQAFIYRQATFSTTGISDGESATFGSKSKVSVSVRGRDNTEKESPKIEEYKTEKNVYSNEDQNYSYNNVTENVYNNVGSKEETEYTNAAALSTEYLENDLQSSQTAPTVEFEARTNQDGLIYMDVVIDPTDQRPKLNTEQVEKPNLAADEPWNTRP